MIVHMRCNNSTRNPGGIGSAPGLYEERGYRKKKSEMKGKDGGQQERPLTNKNENKSDVICHFFDTFYCLFCSLSLFFDLLFVLRGHSSFEPTRPGSSHAHFHTLARRQRSVSSPVVFNDKESSLQGIGDKTDLAHKRLSRRHGRCT